MRRLAPIVAIALLVPVLLLVYGSGVLGYDAFYSLEWGDDLAHLRSPVFERDVAPTPHPLSNVVGALLSLLGGGGVYVLAFLGTVAFAALGWAAYRLGSALFTPVVGVVFAAAVLTREELVRQQLLTYVDVPYLALVLAAASLEARTPRRGEPVLALLLVAGLLRPEAWVFAAAYAVWAATARPREEWPRLAALALAAPVLWLAFDLLVTGNPLHSLTGTRSLAEELARPNTVGDALIGIPTYIRQNLDDTVIIWGGVAGAAAALWLAWQRAVLPLALMAIALATFVAFGLLGLPVLVRYMLLPSLVLALFFAVAVAGWGGLSLPRGMRAAWIAVGALLAALALTTIPAAADRLDAVTERIHGQRRLQTQLGDLLDRGATRALARRCRPVYVPGHHLIPQAAYWLEVSVDDVRSAQVEAPRHGLLVAPASPDLQLGSVLDRRAPQVLEFAVPPQFRRVEARDSWILYRRC